MDVVSHSAFWLLKNGLPPAYSTLREHIECDVLVVGAGITGALVADALLNRGVDVVLIDKDDIASGSTSGSTALLQYEIDTHLIDLTRMYDRTRAERAFWACHEAIDKIEALCLELGISHAFSRKKSAYFASTSSDVKILQAEHAARECAGIHVDYLDKSEIKKLFSFSKPAALLSHQGGEVDPFLLTERLIARAVGRGLRVYDRSGMDSFQNKDDYIRVKTDHGYRIRAKHVIMSSGYEAQKYLPKNLVKLNSSFAMVTKPVNDFTGWHEQCLLWETARPYFYMRTTSDQRILIGGQDKPFRNALARDALIDHQTKKLWKTFKKMFPKIPAEYGYSWGGTFGETRDGLAYIGELPEFPHVHFACGYGGNGITYSVIAAEILADGICGSPHPDAHIFAFDRK